MCPPSPPKAPKVKKINPFQGIQSDPRTARIAESIGIRDISNDDDMRRVTEALNREDFDLNRKDDLFVKAEKQLYEEGGLTGLSNSVYNQKGGYSKEQHAFRKQFEKDNGKKADWKYAWTQENFKYESQDDLQKVYDRQAELENDKYNNRSQKQLKQTEKRYTKEQKKMNDANNARLDEQNEKMMIAQRDAEERQAELMKEMMNQPVYQPRQAALPKMQAKPKTPKPMPVAPAPPPTMSISTAPAPELVSIGNPMGVIKQSSTASSRARRRNKGTSSLT